MALFHFRALNAQAAVVEGTIAADAARGARDQLRSRGLHIESLTAQREAGSRLRLPRRAGKRFMTKRVAMIRELSTLLGAGITLLDALDSLAQQYQGAFQASLLALRDRVAAGSGLAEAMREQPDVYDPLSVHMVEVGENSGTLDSVLDQLASFSERYLQLKDRVTNALFYPIIVFGLSVGVGIFLMTVVVPMLLDNLLEAGKTIPWPTRVLKAMSDFVRGHGLAIIGLGLLTLASLILVLRTTAGRRLWHRWLLKLPLVGTMARKQEIARMSLIIATLLKSGVVLLESIEIAGRALRNVLLREAVESTQTAIRSGRELGEALASTEQFPPTVVQIFTVGQQSGKLEEMLERLAENYDRQVSTLSARLATLLEPVLIVGLALFVGFILFATVLPILEAGNVL